MPTSVPDPDRERVYLSEDRLQALIAHAATAPGGAVLSDGVELRPEPDHRFTTVAEASLYCTLTCLELELPPVTVRLRKGESRSHYSPATATSPAEIALASWGASRVVVVHELSHHVVVHRHRGAADHGVEFRTAMVDLLVRLGLSGQSEALAHCHRTEGL